MKRFTTLFLAAGAIALAGCASTTPLLSTSSAQVTALQSETTLEASYNALATAYLAAAPNLSAATKAQIKPLLAELYAATKAAETAQSLGDATTLASQVAAASSLTGQIKALIPAS